MAKFTDLLISGDDLTPDVGGEPQLTTDRAVIAQDLVHMIRERGYLPPLVGNRNKALAERTMIEITIAVDNDYRIVPGTAHIVETDLGLFELTADTIDFGPVQATIDTAPDTHLPGDNSQPMSAPAGFVLQSIEVDGFILSWAAVDGADGYVLYGGSSADFNPASDGTLLYEGTDSTCLVVASTTPPYSYHYKVAGKNVEFNALADLVFSAALQVSMTALPLNVISPFVSGDGSPYVGDILTCSTGSWYYSPTSYAYQWTRDLVPIPAANSNSYTITEADLGANIACQVTAANAAGSKTAVSNNTIPEAVSGPWNPSELAPILWLDSSDSSSITTVSGKVSEWRDKSGNAHHFSQINDIYRPSLVESAQNEMDAVRFSNHNLKNGTYSFGGAACMVFIAHASSASAVAYNTLFSAKSTATYPYMFFASSDVANYSFYCFGSAGTFARRRVAGCPTPYGRVALAMLGYDAISAGSGSSYRAVVDGADYPTSYPAGYAGGENTESWIGMYQGYQSPHVGDIMEILVTPYLANQADIDKVFGYLAHKWGSQDSLPADHPYKTAAPTV